ncbi:sorting nexin-11 [Conger conger]|uniref:sorting nexin-11 n=1 Tax=Conger conger TaxID=82655 RepID=UPI002A59EB3A|nr:sorting nexin-11 [Conger conger]XP_061088366.1 sorting nexin-11 [Conger conger]XP_061088367.1 sorting nexin-11 [Conger conger]
MIKNQEEDEFIAVRVQDPRVQNEGFWNSYVDFKIFLHTNSKAFTAKTSCVRRRYSEFVWLKKKLQKNSGLVPVPDLPGKTLFFTFSNEDVIERRRHGLQNFLDKVVHMTVCLSDSQLHLFLQTQLPVGHIEDCVQGHTPYTVTDAILTYASSNRGWAQEEESVVQEPSLLSVSYESVDSPAPHLPTFKNEETVEFRASVTETHKRDFQETCTDEISHHANTCVIRGTDTSVVKKCINVEDVLKVDVHETNTCVIKGSDTRVEEECIHEDDVLKVDVHETESCVPGKMEAAIEEKDPCEEHTFKEDVQEINICVLGAMTGGIWEQDASEDPVHEASVHENNSDADSRPDLLDSDTFIIEAPPAQVNERAMKEKNVREEDVHQEDVQETNTCVTEAMEGTIQKKDYSEESVYQAHEHDCKSDVQDLKENEGLDESDVHEANICLMLPRGSEASCKEKHSNEGGVQVVNNYKTSNRVIEGKEDPTMEENCEEEHKVDVRVTNICVVGETGHRVTERDTNHEDVYRVVANGSSISLNRAMAISEKDTNEIACETSAPKANDHEDESFSESTSDSRSDAENVVPIITLSDTHEVDTNEDVHKTDAYNTSTGTADVCELDCLVLKVSDDIPEKASYDAKANTVSGVSEPGLHEGLQDPHGNPIEGHCARSYAIIHKLDDCKADVPETGNQELEPPEMDNHTGFNGQLEGKLSNY